VKVDIVAVTENAMHIVVMLYTARKLVLFRLKNQKR